MKNNIIIEIFHMIIKKINNNYIFLSNIIIIIILAYSIK